MVDFIFLELVKGRDTLELGIKRIGKGLVRVVGLAIEQRRRLCVYVCVCISLVDLGLEAVYSIDKGLSAIMACRMGTWYVLLLEIAVGNVVVAPVRHRIELQAVRELHVVGLAKLLELLGSLVEVLVPALTLALAVFVGRGIEGLELKGLIGRAVTIERGKRVHGGRVVGGDYGNK